MNSTRGIMAVMIIFSVNVMPVSWYQETLKSVSPCFEAANIHEKIDWSLSYSLKFADSSSESNPVLIKVMVNIR